MPEHLSPNDHRAPDLWDSLRARDLKGILHSLTHHWRPVFFLASFFVILQASCTPLAQSLENVSVKVVTALRPEAPAPTQEGGDSEAPVVVLINDEFYESVFKQRSPLDRRVLSEVLKELIALEPKILVIDFDLSPASDSNDREADKELFEFLEAASTGGARLVLATPFPVWGEMLAREALHWMHRLCSHNVRFGQPLLYQSSGVVVRYDRDAPTLGNIASNFERSLTNDPCEAVKDGDLSRAFFLQSSRKDRIPLAPTLSALEPVNDNFYSKHGRFSLSNVEEVKQLGTAVKGRVVFLGGAYGESDRYLTTAGEQVGVTIHAAAYYSAIKPLGHWPAIAHFLLELALGLVVASIFHSSYARLFGYYHIPAYYRRADLGEKSRRARIRGHLAWLFVILGSAVFFALLTLMLSVWLLKGSTWLNPWPFVLGICLKAVFTAHLEQLGIVASGSHSGDPSLEEREDSAKRARFRLWSTLVLGAIALVIVIHESFWRH